MVSDYWYIDKRRNDKRRNDKRRNGQTSEATNLGSDNSQVYMIMDSKKNFYFKVSVTLIFVSRVSNATVYSTYSQMLWMDAKLAIKETRSIVAIEDGYKRSKGRHWCLGGRIYSFPFSCKLFCLERFWRIGLIHPVRSNHPGAIHNLVKIILGKTVDAQMLFRSIFFIMH